MNDFLALLMLNEGKGIEDFVKAGITSSNTQMLLKEDYVNIPEILNMFKTKDGLFDEQAFDNYYRGALSVYNEFVNNDFIQDMYENYMYGPDDTSSASIDKRQTPGVYILKIANPTAKTYGTASVFGVGKDLLSYREAAQRNKVWDYEQGRWLNWTPNDDDRSGLFDFWMQPRLVMATYEEDGVHEENGRQVRHVKGQYKLDEDGNPYYETLGKRNSAGKQFLKLSDTLSDDGSFANLYFDIFDSDSIDKSVTKTVLSTIVSVAPYFIPYVGSIYKTLQIALGAGSLLSALGKTSLELADAENTGAWKFLNNLGAIKEAYSGGLSDKGSASFMNFESIMGIVKDSAHLLFSQRAISLIPSILGMNPYKKLPKSLITKYSPEYQRKYGKSLREAIKNREVSDDFLKTILSGKEGMHDFGTKVARFQRASRSLGSLYMAGVQSANVYNIMKEYEFSPELTAVGLLGSYIGFYKLMQSSLGDVAVRGLGLEGPKRVTRDFAKKVVDDGVKPILNKVNISTAEGRKDAIQRVASKVSGLGKKINPTGLVADMGREGLEEISEEMYQDTLLGLISAADWAMTSDLEERGARYNPFATNMLERYLSVGFGGALGGGVFRGLNKVDLSINNLRAKQHGEVVKEIPKKIFLDIVTLVRNGLARQIKAEIERLMKKGKIAPTNLSLEIDTNNSDPNRIIYKPAEQRSESQNDQIGQYLISLVDAIDVTINGSGMGITDRRVIEAAMDRDIRALALMKSNIVDEIITDFNTLLSEVVATKLQINSAKDSEDTSELESKLNDQQKQLEEFLEGGRKAEFAERMLFDLNRTISAGFYAPDLYIYAYHKGTPWITLNDAQKKALEEEYKALNKEDPGHRKAMFKTYRKLKDLILIDLAKLKSDERGKIGILYYEEIHKLLDKQFDLITGELSDNELDTLLDETIQELRGNQTDEQLTKILNPRKEINFNLSDTLKEVAKNSPIYYLKLVQYKLNKIWNKKYSKDLINKFGVSDLFNNIAATEQESDIRNNLILLLKLIRAIHHNIGFIDMATKDKLQSLIDAIYTIDQKDAVKKLNLLNYLNINNGKLKLNLDITDDADSNAYDNDNWELGDSSMELVIENGQYVIKGEVTLNKDDEGAKYVWINGNKVELDYNDAENKFTLNHQLSEEEAKKLVQSQLLSRSINSYSDLDINNKQELSFYTNEQIYIDWQKSTTLFNLLINTSGNYIMDMLGKISKELTGLNILDIFEAEEKNYKKAGSVLDFVINGSINILQLRDLDKSINILKSILISSMQLENDPFDMPNIINMAKAKANLLEDNVLSEGDVNTILTELSILQNDVNTLIYISDLNSGDKVGNSKLTGMRLNINLIASMIPGEGVINPTYIDKDGNEVGLFEKDILEDDVLNDLLNAYKTNTVTPETYKLSMEALFKINKWLYNKYLNATPEEKVNMMKAIASMKNYPRSGVSTVISRTSTRAELAPEFISNYIFLHMIVDTLLMYNEISRLLSDPTIKFAPFAGLLLDIEMNWAYMQNPEAHNQFLEYVRETNTNKEWETYITRHNIIYSLGDPGSGKYLPIKVKSVKLVNNTELKRKCNAL